ncbi:hypothetical protein IFM89_013776 [Coptis chinensis]|uniref:Uncharacterized protein n=1 Tax=Coptis chinensis TaxID=261450 RepID=A0A835HUP5_9MAGN|nr:hypothetical protein IFM89_013776 [Coptis chinensis]
MKSAVLTSSSSSSSRSNTTEDRDSCYFPGCRKDANCKCEICLASINATLDLLPMSIQKSTLTKFSATKPLAERTPIRFKPSILSTPMKGTSQIQTSPILKSTAKSNFPEEQNMGKEKKRKRKWNIGFYLWRLIVALSVIFAVDSVFTWVVTGILRPTLSPEILKRVGEELWVSDDLAGKLRLLQRNLEGLVNENVSNCSSVDSSWRLIQDGLLARSRCTLYSSIAEEVSIWGWPLQNAGLLVSGFSSTSFTILSGRLIEWPNGNVEHSVRQANSSWILERLSASVVKMEPNTWVLEYKQNPVLGDSRLSLAALQFLNIRISRVLEKLKNKMYMVPSLIHQYSYNGEDNFHCPT